MSHPLEPKQAAAAQADGRGAVDEGIPFDFVDWKDARQVLEASLGQADAARAVAELLDPALSRSASTPEDRELSSDARAWMNALPEQLRPETVAREFPRIVNRLAALWHQPLRCEAFFQPLIFVDRNGRQGFPEAVAGELHQLFDYFQNVLYPKAESAWNDSNSL